MSKSPDTKQALERERQERTRRRWEQSPEGQATLERQCLEREEGDRLRRARCQAIAADVARKRAEAEEAAARAAWQRYHESTTLSQIAQMKGWEFEQFLARLLTKMGYVDVLLTPNNDQGADILCTSADSGRIAVQAKRWKGRVGNNAVQEIVGAMHYYKCQSGLVITNSAFTTSAITLAAVIPGVELRDYYWLKQQIETHLPPEVPEFNWDVYNSTVKGRNSYAPPSAAGSAARSSSYQTRKRKSKKKWRRW